MGTVVPESIALLRSTHTVRARAGALLARARSGQSDFFTIDDAALPVAAAKVVEVTRARYPDLRIPFHSRWRHFEAGGIDRKALLDAALAPPLALLPSDARAKAAARSYIDLALVSVLLDAGAGALWTYREQGTTFHAGRSEGLGVASFHAFMSGLFSSDPAQPLQADAQGLLGVTAARLGQAFQVQAENPLVGLEGRVTLLRALGHALQAQAAVFGTAARPGNMLDVLAADPAGSVTAHQVLTLLLNHVSSIWPAANAVDGIAVGDCWQHPAVQGEGSTRGWMPFHKLSQWLTYSLLEPLQWAGLQVQGLDELTGLPEYRNGGLLLDAGVIRFQQPGAAKQSYVASAPLIVEWRALTVALLDELAPLVRNRLGLSAAEMPLACILEGGTWAAGRAYAQELRHGLPPLNIQSDGTVF